MKRKSILFTLIFLFIFACDAIAAPKRIMSLSPVATEILFALGEGDHIVGVTRFCDYPKAALTKPVLCDFAEINYEAMIRAKVDLVVLQDMHRQAVDDLEALGINYVILSQNSISGIMNSILQIGKICNKNSVATALVHKMKQDVAVFKKKLHSTKRKSVLICVSRDIAEDDIYSFYVAGGNVFYNELLEIVGAKNVLCESPIQYPLLTIDSLMTIKPDVVFDLVGDFGKTHCENSQSKILSSKIRKTWGKNLHARNIDTKVIPLIGTKFLRPGPRITEILQAMYEVLY